ncbi:alpha/beta hydrolase [Spirilliplanes yamanashiensis]|uniref:Esterase n=1 Tax=Spirilliplanes yamanashiensis TaxID=42233 RepID=A0A8J3YBC2_9ACTN|nr:alpha/beta hydrolase [Spirilliplanes yamanashiensis]MDP9818026.1 acetyl esterase/lipase [Spirilliplanes yamanashiensis]GIJ04835.1 esterase [Spirilliplanes yamanashiensis]
MTERHPRHTAPETIDPVLLAALPGLRAAGRARPLTAGTLAAARALGAAEVPTVADLARGGRIRVEEHTTASGVPLYVLSPPGGPARAAVLHIHGGGMVAGAARADLTLASDWVEQLGVTVVSPEYRLAPEHPFPAGADDCFAALGWTAERHATVVVAGVSAGGNLAAATALLARDRGGPALAGQLLVCPMLDDRTVPEPGEPPELHNTWDRWDNLFGWTALLGDARGTAGVSPYAAPARARVDGLPPAYLDVGSADVFLDEDVAYARRLWAAGVACELHVWAGGFHGFEFGVPDAPVSVAARRARTDWLRRLLDARQGEPERRA